MLHKIKYKFLEYLQKKLGITSLKKQIYDEINDIILLKKYTKMMIGFEIRKNLSTSQSIDIDSSSLQNNLSILSTNTSYSQYAQDCFVLGLLGIKKDGICVEIGAGDGKTFSNSLFFEQSQDWKCILIEPNETLWNTLIKNRPNSILVNSCISSEKKEVTFSNFVNSEYLSGINKNFNKKHLKRKDLSQTVITTTVQTRTFEDVFDEHNITKVDYLSLDTEGSELECLQGINFDKVDITLMGIEIDYEENFETFNNFLKTKGYVFVQRVGGDCFFYKTKKKLQN